MAHAFIAPDYKRRRNKYIYIYYFNTEFLKTKTMSNNCGNSWIFNSKQLVVTKIATYTHHILSEMQIWWKAEKNKIKKCQP